MSEHDHAHEMINPRLNDAIAAGCEESRLILNRRAMLGVSAGLFSWACLPRHAEAFDGDPRLVIVTMRGGLDGLHVVYPAAERETLRAYRGRMFEAHNRQIDYLVDGYKPLGNTGFVINRKLSNFSSMFNQGTASLIHSIAPPLRSRSHFDNMDNLENGRPGLGNPSKDGWLNRLLAGLADNQPVGRALSVNGLPLILKGQADVDSWSAIELLSLGSNFDTNMLAAYRRRGGLFADMADKLDLGLDIDRLATPPGAAMAAASPARAPATAQNAMMAPAAPDGPLTASFRGAARLMKRSEGPRIAVVSLDGLDTHSGQMSLLDTRLQELDNALNVFRAELGTTLWQKTVVVCVTEFGRTARVNLAGTDHGTGTVALLAGGNVKGGQVVGKDKWPGIGTTDLYEGRDLEATHDIRALFKGVLKDHLGVRNDKFLNDTVFPESAGVQALGGLIKIPAQTNVRLRA